MADRDADRKTDILEHTRSELKEPDMFHVVLHNDDYTTREFVVEILRVVFHKPVIEATKIMLDVHKKGRGIVGAYTWDIAKTKTAQVHHLARGREYPLRCTVEQA